jgi:hypothetical protein
VRVEVPEFWTHCIVQIPRRIKVQALVLYMILIKSKEFTAVQSKLRGNVRLEAYRKALLDLYYEILGLTSLSIKITALSDVPSCNLVNRYHRFGGTFCIPV